MRRLWNNDVYELDEGTFTVETGAAYLQNEDGGWTCVQNILSEGSGFDTSDLAGPAYTLRCVGEDGYEGLSAILASEFVGSTPNEEFVGLIFSGDLPPLPEPAAAE